MSTQSRTDVWKIRVTWQLQHYRRYWKQYVIGTLAGMGMGLMFLATCFVWACIIADVPPDVAIERVFK